MTTTQMDLDNLYPDCMLSFSVAAAGVVVAEPQTVAAYRVVNLCGTPIAQTQDASTASREVAVRHAAAHFGGVVAIDAHGAKVEAEAGALYEAVFAARVTLGR